MHHTHTILPECIAKIMITFSLCTLSVYCKTFPQRQCSHPLPTHLPLIVVGDDNHPRFCYTDMSFAANQSWYRQKVPKWAFRLNVALGSMEENCSLHSITTGTNRRPLTECSIVLWFPQKYPAAQLARTNQVASVHFQWRQIGPHHVPTNQSRDDQSVVRVSSNHLIISTHSETRSTLEKHLAPDVT